METWIQTISVILTVLGTAYYIHKDIREDMKTQSARTDKLYEMFIDLLKQKSSGRKLNGYNNTKFGYK